MRKLLIAGLMSAFALPVLANEPEAETDRLSALETIVVTTQKEEPATTRLEQIEQVVITSEKAQPADYAVDEKTAALLAEINSDK